MDSRGVHIESKRVHELLLPLQDIKALPFNRGLKPIEDLIVKKGEKLKYFKQDRAADTKSEIRTLR